MFQKEEYFSSSPKFVYIVPSYNNKEWYETKSKPYTLGICTYGLPGCGKTSSLVKISSLLNKEKNYKVKILSYDDKSYDTSYTIIYYTHTHIDIAA